MLKQISCDKFIENGSIRSAIVFHKGLNTVMGSDTGSNSIGKSTFLMVLDFVFGGEDYVMRSTDVQEEISVHTIKFVFEFERDENLHYFSRSTGDYTVVNVCDEQFNPIKTISLEKYSAFLASKYGLDLPGLSLRNAISRFFRVYGRETLDEKYPLKTFTKETDKSQIEGLLKLYNKYAAVEQQTKIAEAAKDEELTFRKARKYQYVTAVPNKTVYKENIKRIDELQGEAIDLAKSSSKGLLDMDSLKAQRLAELKHQLSNFKRQRIRLIAQKKRTEADRDFTKHSFQKDYASLLEFFPEVKVKQLEEIEEFHKKLSKILKKEFKQNADSIQAMIDLATSEINALETQIYEISDVPNVLQAILDRYAQVQRELQHLKDANLNFEKADELKERTKKLTDALNALVIEVIGALQQELNTKMKALNDFIYDGRKTAPMITIQDASHYLFNTPKDTGTGSRYKGLVVFDLASLEMTNLPVLVHDSVLLKQIEDDAMEKILELYNKSSKQVFIALDKGRSYTEKSQEILNKTKVLQLYSKGGELFGRSWNETN
jgi:hypothetical protein